MMKRLFTLLVALVGLTATMWADGGHAYVDLGLPSGTLWAAENLAATAVSDNENLYQWGETEVPGFGATWGRYCRIDDYVLYSSGQLTKYNAEDGLTELEEADDAASQQWGTEWCIPSKAQWEELMNPRYTTMEWETDTESNYDGFRITSLSNGNSIFLPALGSCTNEWGTEGGNERCCYWTRNLTASGSYSAYYAELTQYDRGVYEAMRYNGIHVRPVRSGGYPGGVVRELDVTRYDVNQDGALTLTDLTLLANALVGRVNYPLTSIEFSTATLTLLTRSSARLVVNFTPANADYRQVYYTSSNPAVATVDADGNLVAVGVGTCTFTAFTIDGSNLSATCQVTVTEPSGTPGGYVDLGLPSGTLWATCNVGATKPEEYGDYFAWDETTTKSEYSDGNYVYSANPAELPTSADAAYVNWGSDWRMPSKEQFEELINSSYTTTTWTTLNGVTGYLITSIVSGYEGNNIFLPATGFRYGSSLYNGGSYGHYWSRTLNTSNTLNAYYLIFDSGHIYTTNSRRYNGQSVRPVRASQ